MKYLFCGNSLGKKEAYADWERAHAHAIKENKNLPENCTLKEGYGIKRIDTATCRILKHLEYSEDQAIKEGYDCTYQWEKA